jgi:hypothetical protein
MLSIAKRAAGLGAVVAVIAVAGPISGASAATLPTALPVAGPVVSQPTGPIAGAYQAGIDAAVGGWNAGADAAIGGWNAGAAALGVPFSFTQQTAGPLGLHTAGVTLPAPTL